MSKRWIGSVTMGALLLGGCAPARTAPAPAAPAPGSATPAAGVAAAPAAVPVPPSYREALRARTRAPSGAPGPAYWQQRVRYRIEAELDPESARLRGREWVTYHNRSPDTLSVLVLKLYQNVFAPGVPRNRYAAITGGVTLERVATQGVTLQEHPTSRIGVLAPPSTPAYVRPRQPDEPVGYAVQGTLSRVVLPRPLPPGDSLTLEVAWRHDVPPAPTFRTAWEDALGARALQVAQWYPQIATYDDLRGWDATPYLGDGEFYLEYGDFDVSLSLPAGHLVGASGELLNPDEVLTDEARARLRRALASDEVVPVVTRAEAAAGRSTRAGRGGRLTWRFRAERVRDFAFAVSRGYVWDATRARITDDAGRERTVAVHALYRPGAPHWEDAARFARHSVAFHSRQLIPYLYPQITVAEGSVGGMEYPMLVFIGKPRQEEALYSVISHEIGHQWFPMMVGSDEAAYAWMDEGVTSFVEGLSFEDFYPGRSGYAGDLRGYLAVAGTEREVPSMRRTDLASPFTARTVAAYGKPAVVMRALRGVLGDSVFDLALRTYAREWLLRHPTPWDLFATFERVSGRELDWFFHPWLFGTGVLDLAVERVEGAESGTARVTVRSLGEVAMPAVVVGTTAAGDTVRASLPVESWRGGAGAATVTLRAPAALVRVEVRSPGLELDAAPANNVWPAPAR